MIHPRRSLLFMPGSNARALEKARNLPADGIILDLEDSVAPEAKALARDQIAQAIAARGFGKREVWVRTNSIDTPSIATSSSPAFIPALDAGIESTTDTTFADPSRSEITTPIPP